MTNQIFFKLAVSILLFQSNLLFAFEYTERVPAGVKLKLSDDLQELKKMNGGPVTPLNKTIFGTSWNNLSGQAYYNFFMSRVKTIDTEESQHDFFVNAGGLKDPAKLYITTEYEKYLKTMPQIERWAVLIHEARHNESPNNWPHSLCPKIFNLNGKAIVAPWGEGLAGKYACDSQALGSYGITIVMARNIELHCESCSKDLRRQAGTYARSILLRITEPSALKILKKDLYPKEI